MQTTQVGNGVDTGVNQRPLIEEAAVQKGQRHVDDAVAKGACVLTGGPCLSQLGLGLFFEPTVRANASADMLCAREETFGPMAPVFRFQAEKEVIDAANATEFGLASYFYSRDVGRILRVSEALEYAMVGVNVAILATEQVPFGGVKQSGLASCQRSSVGIAQRHQKRGARRGPQPMPGHGQGLQRRDAWRGRVQTGNWALTRH